MTAMSDQTGIKHIFRAVREGRLEDHEAVAEIAALRNERAREDLQKGVERAVAGGRFTVARGSRG